MRPGCYEVNWLPPRVPLLLLSLHHMLPPILQAEIGNLILDLQKCEFFFLKKASLQKNLSIKVFSLRCFVIAMKDKLWRVTVGHSSSSVLTKGSVYFLLMSLINGGSGREVGSGKHSISDIWCLPVMGLLRLLPSLLSLSAWKKYSWEVWGGMFEGAPDFSHSFVKTHSHDCCSYPSHMTYS